MKKLFVVLMPLMALADTEIIDGITWTYTVTDGKAQVGTGIYYSPSAIPSTTGGAITIPSILGGCPVTSIGMEAFGRCNGLTSVTIPPSVTSIGDLAFYGCSGLTYVTIPSGVTSIGSEAFYDCRRLTSVTIPSSVASIGSGAFKGTPFLNNQPDGMVVLGGGVLYVCKGECPSSVTIPSGVTSIGDSAFYGCSGLTSVTIPEGVTSIGNFAFYNCSGLTTVTIPPSVTSIGYEAFDDTPFYNTLSDGMVILGGVLYEYRGKCPSSVIIPENVKSIGTDVFRGCSGLTSVTIPSSVTSIGSDAFYGCSGLTSVWIPGGVTNIGWRAFGGCAGLIAINVDESNSAYSSLDGILYDKTKSELILCPQSKSGSVMTMPSVRSIGDTAFEDCNGLSSVTISLAVTNVGWSAFSNCTNLTVVLNCACPFGYEDSGITSVKSVVLPSEYLDTYPQARDHIKPFYVGSSCALIIDGVDGKTYTQFTGEMEPSSSLSEHCRLVIGYNGEVRFLVPGEYSITEHYGWKYIVARVEGEYAGWHLDLGNPAFRGYACCALADEWFYQYWERGTLSSRSSCRRGDVIAITPQDGDWPWLEYSEFGYQMGEYADFLDEVYYMYLPRADGGYYSDEYEYCEYSGLEVYIGESVCYVRPEYDVVNVAYDLGWQGAGVQLYARQPADWIQDPWCGEWVDIKPCYDGWASCENGDYYYYTRHQAGWGIVDGWRFVGWVDAAGSFYEDISGFWCEGDSIGFVAQYELIRYGLAYIDERGTEVSNPAEFNVQDSVDLNAPMDVVGWTFLGWFDEFDERITNTSQLSAQDHTLTAKWDRVYNKVLFEIEGCGEFDSDELVAQDVAWGDSACVPGTIPGLGWRFSGWSEDVLRPIFSNSVFVARFEMVTNKISYLDTKFVQNTNAQCYVVSDEIKFAALSDLPDWHFDGWSPASIPVGSTGDVTVVAQWRPIKTAEIVGAWSEPQTFEYDGKVHGVDYSARLDVMDWPLNVVTQGTIRAVNVGEYAATARAETVGVPETETVYYRCVAVTNECKWTITSKPVTKLQITYVSTAMIANGQQQKPQIVVRDVERGVLLTSADYALAYENNVEPGMGIARITGMGNYGGETTIEFPIVAGVSPAEGLNMDGGTFEIVGETDWVADNAVTHDGYASMRSGAIGDNEESVMEAVVHGAGTVSFWWKVSSQHFDELELDRLEFHVDGVRKEWINGEVGWTKVAFTVEGAGPHTLRWVYAKDMSRSEGADCGWVDEVRWEKKWLPGDWLNDVDRDYASSGVAWVSDNAVSVDGVGSMRSGVCAKGETSSISSVFERTGTLTFKWKCSCVEYGPYRLDSLACLVDGEEIAWINGEKDWAEVSHRIIGNGPHTVTWVFSKTSSEHAGSDCGWLDEVLWDSEPVTLSEDDFTVTSYSGVYDGKPHSVVITAPNVAGATVSYGLAEDTIDGAESPNFTDAGEYMVFFKITAPDCHDYVGSARVVVSPLSIEGAAVTLGESLVYAGNVQTQTVASVTVGGLAATFEVSDDTACAAGAYQLTVTGTGNFCGELSVPFTVAKAQAPSGDVTVEGYSSEAGAVEFTYDGKTHQPIVVAGYDGAAVVRFALTEEGPYADELNVSNVVERMDVWYEIVSANYERLVGQTQMTIRPQSIAGAEVVLGEQVSDAEGHVVQLVDSVIVNGLSATFVVSNNVAEAEGDFKLSVYGVGNFEGEAKCPYSVDGIVLPPVLTPGDGTIFTESLIVRFSAQTPDSKWYYTLDGSMPTTNSLKASRVNLHGKTTIRAIAVLDGKLRSAVVEAHYALGACENPTVRLDGRDGCVFHFPGQLVVIDRNGDEGVVRYTLDGSEPTAESPAYEGPFVISASTTVKAKTFSDIWFDSETVNADMRLEVLSVPSPVIRAASEYKGTRTTVSMSCALEGAIIRYTLDGSEPTATSAVYEKPFEIGGKVGLSIQIMARAFRDDYEDSPVAEAAVTRVWGIGDTLGVPDLMFATDGWMVDSKETFDGRETMRSGPTDDGESNALETVVHGGGTISFAWRTSCEDSSGDFIWDRAEFWVDEECVAKVEGETSWNRVEHVIPDDGADHVLRWLYVKDPDLDTAEGEDCAWLAALSWGRKDVLSVIVVDDPNGKIVLPPGKDISEVEVKVICNGSDIFPYLNLPAAENGVIDLAQAMVKDEIVKEPLDTTKGAKVELSADNPKITTAPTKPGLTYTLREGETLDGMKDGDSTVGDGQPWTPEITVKGGNSAFYSIGVGKGE